MDATLDNALLYLALGRTSFDPPMTAKDKFRYAYGVVRDHRNDPEAEELYMHPWIGEHFYHAALICLQKNRGLEVPGV